jgi:hypothetical protein
MLSGCFKPRVLQFENRSACFNKDLRITTTPTEHQKPISPAMAKHRLSKEHYCEANDFGSTLLMSAGGSFLLDASK